MVAASSCDDGSNRPLASGQSAARQWDEQLLGAIRRDNPRPTVHARNLFHVSAAMWDAWAAYDADAAQYLVDERATSDDVEHDRTIAISYAAYRVLFHRYSPGLARRSAPRRRASTRAWTSSASTVSFTSTEGDSPAAVGNRIAAAAIAFGANDGADEAGNYADPTYGPSTSRWS